VRLRPEQLPEHLRGALAPIYLIAGDEPLQVEEALDAVRAAARAAGYDERVVLHAESGFDWSTLAGYARSLSLFSEKRVIDLRIPGGRPGDDGARALRAYAERPAPDTLLLVGLGKFETPIARAKWYQVLAAAGVEVQAWPIDATRLPDWASRRASGAGLRLSREAARFLAERSEGNLLALVQEIEKLALLHPGAELGVEELLDAVADSARFSAFDLVDSALEGQAARALRILGVLREEGAPPLQVLGALAWALRGVARIAPHATDPRGLDAVLAKPANFTWRRRKALLAKALRRHRPSAWYAL